MGQIIGQRPLEGSKLRKGESLAVTVAKAPTTAKVPTLVGQGLAEARAALETAHLSVGKVTEETNDKEKPDSVTAQAPVAGTLIALGAKVDLTVAKAVPTVPVPNVVGRGFARAKAELTKAGLTVAPPRYRDDEDHGEGIVLEQTPAAGQPAPKGSAVELVINRT